MDRNGDSGVEPIRAPITFGKRLRGPQDKHNFVVQAVFGASIA